MMRKWVGLVVLALIAVVVTGGGVWAANEMLQLDIYTWLRLRDHTLLLFGTSDDFYARYDGVSAVELRAGDGSELATVDAAGVAITGDLDIGGQLEAGTGNHTLTTEAGLIDGAKIAPGTITGTQVYSSGASPGDMLIIDADGNWAILAMSGHGALAASGALTIQTYTGATAGDAGVEGLVPAATAGAANRFLCADGSWSVPGIGAVTGPGASTDRAIAIWDGTDGDTVQNSLVLISTSGGVTIPGTLTLGTGAHVLTNAAGLLDGGKLQTGTVTSTQLSTTGVTAGSYTVPAITVDAKGRVTAAANGSLGLIDLDDGETAYTGAAGYPLVVSSTEDGWEFAAMLDPSVLPQLVGDSGSGGTSGIVPAPDVGDAAAGKYLAADGTWATPAGSGNVAGPGTSTDNALALFDGVNGQTLQDSTITSADGASLVIPGTITAGSGAHALTSSAGLLDGGKLQAGSVGIPALDIAGGTAATTADDADLIAIYDDSATANRVMTRANFLAGISGGDDMGAVDTEAELESTLTDVTDVLTDNDAEYEFLIDSAGTAGQVWTSDGSGKGGWAAATGGGASAFTDLTDAPSSYTGQAGKYVRVASGETTLEFATVSGGTGGGPDTLCVLLPHAYFPSATAYATRDTRNSTPVLDFDADTDESALWLDVMPVRYAGGGLTVDIMFAMTSATNGDVVWCAQFERIGIGEQSIESDDFASEKSAVVSVYSIVASRVKQATLTFTDGAEMDSLESGEPFRIRVYRDADNAYDTATGDAELVAVHIKETP